MPLALVNKAALVLTTFERLSVLDLDPQDTICHICNDDYSHVFPDTESETEAHALLSHLPYPEARENPLRLPCGHIFGDECLTIWLNRSDTPTCPQCRQALIAKPEVRAEAAQVYDYNYEYSQSQQELEATPLDELINAHWTDDEHFAIPNDPVRMVRKLMAIVFEQESRSHDTIMSPSTSALIQELGSIEALVSSYWNGNQLDESARPEFYVALESLRFLSGTLVEPVWILEMLKWRVGEMARLGLVHWGEDGARAERRFGRAVRGMVEFERRYSDLMSAEMGGDEEEKKEVGGETPMAAFL